MFELLGPRRSLVCVHTPRRRGALGWRLWSSCFTEVTASGRLAPRPYSSPLHSSKHEVSVHWIFQINIQRPFIAAFTRQLAVLMKCLTRISVLTPAISLQILNTKFKSCYILDCTEHEFKLSPLHDAEGKQCREGKCLQDLRKANKVLIFYEFINWGERPSVCVRRECVCVCSVV